MNRNARNQGRGNIFSRMLGAIRGGGGRRAAAPAAARDTDT